MTPTINHPEILSHMISPPSTLNDSQDGVVQEANTRDFPLIFKNWRKNEDQLPLDNREMNDWELSMIYGRFFFQNLSALSHHWWWKETTSVIFFFMPDCQNVGEQ